MAIRKTVSDVSADLREHEAKCEERWKTIFAETEEIKKDTHIIHWGHLRDEENQLVKSNMRQKFAIWDRADGSNLLKYNNWYNRRNELWDTQVKPLPNQIQQFIKTV